MVSGSGISWPICKSAPLPRQITMPAPHHSVFNRLAKRLFCLQSKSKLSFTVNVLLHLLSFLPTLAVADAWLGSSVVSVTLCVCLCVCLCVSVCLHFEGIMA